MAPRVLVLISGNGSNLQALIDASRANPPTLDAAIIHVISNKKAAYGLKRAADAGISSTYHNLLAYKKKNPNNPQEAREAYDADLAKLILAQTPDLVVCAGWMHILSPTALKPLKEAGVDIINLHPALPGQFDGANAIDRAYEAFQRGEITKTGIMIHHVITAVDRGAPIIVREIEMIKGESLEDLENRIHAVEHIEIVNGTRMALEEREKNK
ncbi:phosphoribosylglycinamide formyltransferase [Choiromyces venosus 120613-1]|uniref:Phosphoribosylglycinamide formyltransferase n=1 Tax=Choiromyces venosus 120613-1 TaxID=1336337 RepID=A0A3N4JY82_9PEZI|nr:phosphoribosylglycinamide formyltransferase [Choiromyces venosus 120613-1]